MSSFRIIRQLMIPVLALGLVAAACGDDEGSDSTEAIEFGSGEIPESVPDDFPIPALAVIGTTLVNHPAAVTEVNMVIGTDLTSVVSVLTVDLVNEGYVIDRSVESGGQWIVEFSDGSLSGSVLLVPSGRNTQATLRIVDP